MAICLGGADINSVLTLLMNPPPATDLYANCHGSSGISRMFLLFIQLQSTAVIYNTCKKYHFVEVSAAPVLELQASVPSMQLRISLCLPKFSCKCKLYKRHATMKTGNLANSFIRKLFHPCSFSTGRSLDHATIGKGVTQPFALCGGACLQGPS